MSISIVTVTYNSSEKIIPLLNTVDMQTGIDKLEIIIVDNNSSDVKKLKRTLSKYSFRNKKYSLVTKYRQKNLGFGCSCNYGASIAKYQNIVFLNPDTKLVKTSLSTLLDHAKKTNANICGGKCLQINTKNIHRTIFNEPTINTMLFEYSNLGKLFSKSGNFYLNQNYIKKDTNVDGVGGAYFLIDKKSFIKLGGFDENIFMYLEDVDICIRAKRLGLTIVYCPHSTIYHIGGASSNNKYHIAHKAWFNSREYYVKKHFSPIVSIPIIIIYKIERILLNIRMKISNV